MTINKNSLQARINKLSNKTGIHQNVLLKTFFFDAFLKRLSVSKYCDNFVFKGGFLLSTSLGIDLRSTMDIDFLLERINIEKNNIINMLMEISAIDVKDNVSFEYKDIEEIRKDDEYGGYNITFLGKLENIKELISIDIATGDPITPSAIDYHYKCFFDEEILKFKAYNYETVLAEKLQTILTRGIVNSRCKDFYDVFIIHKLRWDSINKNDLRLAFKNTCNYRNTLFTKDEAMEIICEIEKDARMFSRWNSYKKRNKFVENVSFEDTIKSIKLAIHAVFNEGNNL